MFAGYAMIPKIIPVILCGGTGQRLWPVSRATHPKQFHRLFGDLSPFQATVERVSGGMFATPIIVTGNDHRFLVADQLRLMNAKAKIVLEPLRRDSCAAIAAAAEIAARQDEDPLVLVLAADHAIPDIDGFLDHVRRGAKAAQAGRIVTFGIRPSEPATGYGYIQPGDELDGIEGVNSISAFVEKPDRETAERYVAEGYLWNSGNFLFRASDFLGELQRLAPDIAEPVRQSVDAATTDLDFLRLEPQHFADSRATSVDYAVMEKTGLAAVVPSDFGWSDIGSWNAVWAIAEKQDNGNAAIGHAVFQDLSNSFVHSSDTLTAVLGLDDVIVVSMRDTVLVAARDKSEDVKALVNNLAAAGREEVNEHKRVYRPWGDYEQVDAGHRYQVKRITVKPGGRLSLQSHRHRAEHWVVVTGTAKVTIDGEEFIVHENQSTFIPIGATHRLENPGKIPLEIIEVQSGSYLGEDDIIRYEDIYGRD